MKTEAVFYVGNARLDEMTNSYVSCGVCGRIVRPSEAAAHVAKKHPSVGLGVLAGQLGLPYTGVADVPG